MSWISDRNIIKKMKESTRRKKQITEKGTKKNINTINRKGRRKRRNTLQKSKIIKKNRKRWKIEEMGKTQPIKFI